MSTKPGLSGDVVLMANVARRFHLHGQSKSEIGAALGLSRFRVARILQAALDKGIVRIEIGLPGSVNATIGDQLCAAFGIDVAVVVEVDEQPPAPLLRSLSLATAELLGEVLTSNDVLGLASARSILNIGDDLVAFPACPVVQLTGAVSRPDALDIIQAIRGLTRVGGGEARVFYAPIISSDSAAGLRRNPDVQRAVELLPSVTTAVVGVGQWGPGLSSVYDVVSPADRIASAAAGVAIEVAGILLDGKGRPVQTPLAERTLAPTFEQLMAIPRRVAVTFGTVRAAAVATALRTGVVNALITHRTMAEEILLQA